MTTGKVQNVYQDLYSCMIWLFSFLADVSCCLLFLPQLWFRITVVFQVFLHNRKGSETCDSEMKLWKQ